MEQAESAQNNNAAKIVDIEFSPADINLNQRHTKIMGSIQYSKANRRYLKDMVKNGLDGIRFFCDDGYD